MLGRCRFQPKGLVFDSPGQSELPSGRSAALGIRAAGTKAPSGAQFKEGKYHAAISLLEQLKYIRQQDEHHRTMTFEGEYRTFLRKHGIDFDERYVWD